MATFPRWEASPGSPREFLAHAALGGVSAVRFESVWRTRDTLPADGLTPGNSVTFSVTDVSTNTSNLTEPISA